MALNCTLLFTHASNTTDPTSAAVCASNAPVENVLSTSSGNANAWIPMLVFSILIVIANSFICVAFLCNRGIRTRPANILVFSQACIDLLNALLFIPLKTAEYYYTQQSITPYVVCYVLFLSLFNLFALAIDRSLALLKPLYHHFHIGRTQILKWVFIIWVIPLFLSLIPFGWQFQSAHVSLLATRIYLSSMWLFMFTLCVVMACMYCKIYVTARRMIRQRHETLSGSQSKEQRGSVTRKELRIAHLFALLLVFFFLAYLPVLYMNFANLIQRQNWVPKQLPDISLYSLVINSVVNPILCIWFKKDYQTSIASLFQRRKSKPRPVLGESLRSSVSRVEENNLFSPRPPVEDQGKGNNRDSKNLPTVFESEAAETNFMSEVPCHSPQSLLPALPAGSARDESNAFIF